MLEISRFFPSLCEGKLFGFSKKGHLPSCSQIWKLHAAFNWGFQAFLYELPHRREGGDVSGLGSGLCFESQEENWCSTDTQRTYGRIAKVE
ncbi:hypothetical protein VNO77_39079 [Canavalia gladiata]|uniref:Uncharacterized protein n=1 Tax=Canavalia gladiata TaxID=3824 RepID=A0AAN9KC07_CANGL